MASTKTEILLVDLQYTMNELTRHLIASQLFGLDQDSFETGVSNRSNIQEHIGHVLVSIVKLQESGIVNKSELEELVSKLDSERKRSAATTQKGPALKLVE